VTIERRGVMRPLTIIVVILLGTAGCSGRHSHADFLPPEQKARQALETALTAWQNGRPIKDIGASSPAIVVEDSQWKAGKRLEHYEIVNSEPGDGPIRFGVQLKLHGVAAPQEMRYVVIGIDPLLVYSEKDFQKLSGSGM
jgi:hypothetical protein